MQGILTGDKKSCEILDPIILQHFDNRPLVTRSSYMDDKVREVARFLQQNVTMTLTWPFVNPVLNSLECT